MITRRMTGRNEQLAFLVSDNQCNYDDFSTQNAGDFLDAGVSDQMGRGERFQINLSTSPGLRVALG